MQIIIKPIDKQFQGSQRSTVKVKGVIILSKISECYSSLMERVKVGSEEGSTHKVNA